MRNRRNSSLSSSCGNCLVEVSFCQEAQEELLSARVLANGPLQCLQSSSLSAAQRTKPSSHFVGAHCSTSSPLLNITIEQWTAKKDGSLAHHDADCRHYSLLVYVYVFSSLLRYGRRRSTVPSVSLMVHVHAS